MSWNMWQNFHNFYVNGIGLQEFTDTSLHELTLAWLYLMVVILEDDSVPEKWQRCIVAITADGVFQTIHDCWEVSLVSRFVLSK